MVSDIRFTSSHSAPFFHYRASVSIWYKWQYSIRDPTVQRVTVCHREEWSHSGVSPEWRHWGLTHGGPLLRPTQPGWWAARPCRGEWRWAVCFYCVRLRKVLCFYFVNICWWQCLMCVCPQAFAQNVLSKADVIQATGDAVCIFKELQCLTPRGR